MTRRLFQNRQKVSELKDALERHASRTDSSEEFTKRQLFAQLANSAPPKAQHRSHWLAIASASAMIICGILLFYHLFGTHSQSDTVPVRRLAESGLPTMVGGLINALPLNKPVTVPDTAGAKFVMNDQSTIWADSDTRLMFRTSAGDLNLDKGRLLAQFNPRRSPTQIHTDNGTVQIVGTVFSVTAAPEVTEIRLFEGKITVLSNGKKKMVQAGSYVRIEHGVLKTERSLDASDIISALLITEKTFHLSGPKVPELQIPYREPSDKSAIVETDTSEKKARKRTRRIPSRNAQKDTSPDNNKRKVPYELPPEDDMQIEHQTAPDPKDAAVPEVPAAEQLLQDACDSLKKGDHKTGKARIRDYLKTHRNDRYWEHVQSVFDDTR